MNHTNTDRAVGILLGTACGDALGAGYEFGPPLPADAEVRMGGGPNSLGWAPGEWTDDTSMAIPLARGAARGERFDDAALDEIVAAWKNWARDARDVGTQTRAVLSACDGTAASARAASRALHERTGRSGGNGSLMRTAPVALAYLDDGLEEELADASRRVSELTHWDADAGDACVLWTAAIRHGIRTGELDVRVGLPLLGERARRWSSLLDEAELLEPRDFSRNGWVVEALQAAWSALVRGDGVVDTLEGAVRGGRDTDTVAAIAGGLLGAVHGGSAFPAAWRRILHGWPGLTTRDLTELAILATRGGHPDALGWPTADHRPPTPGSARALVRHPFDDGVWMASLSDLPDLPAEVDAVVSLCRVGRRETDLESVEFWLIDEPGANPNLEFIVDDAADTIAALRAEGKVVAVHCYEARSRTAVVSAAYAVRHRGVEPREALTRVVETLPEGRPNSEFRSLILGM